MKIAPLATFGLIALLAQGFAAVAAEVKVMAGAAMSGAFGELLPQFERATGHRVVIQYGATGAFKKQIEAGEAFDLAIFCSDGVDDLIKQGKIVGDTRLDIARVGIAVAVREGASKPDISSADAFKTTLLTVKSVTYTQESAATPHLIKVLDRLGIAEQVKAKTKLNPPNRVTEAVAAGEVELAIANAPGLMSAKGVQLVGLLPVELQNWFVNTAGIGSAARNRGCEGADQAPHHTRGCGRHQG